MKFQSNFPELFIIAIGLFGASILILYGMFYMPPMQTVSVIYRNDSAVASSEQNTDSTEFNALTTDNNTALSNSKSADVININTADKETLTTLTGIGDYKAQNIVDYRNSNGNFNTIEDIMLVKGIGKNTFENIKDNITV